MEWIKVTLPHFPGGLTALSLLKILASFIIFEILFYVGAITKDIFCVKIDVKLAHLSVVPKFYNSLIPLNEVWPRLPPKYFGQLSEIYQLNIIRLHLWKLWVYSSWGKLRSYHTVLLGAWLLFPLKHFGKLYYFWNSLSCSRNY